jgi:hypothetical protein
LKGNKKSGEKHLKINQDSISWFVPLEAGMYIYIYIHVYIYVCVYIYMYNMDLYMCIYMHIYMHIYIHIFAGGTLLVSITQLDAGSNMPNWAYQTGAGECFELLCSLLLPFDWFYMFYAGHIDCENLFHIVILSKHYYHHQGVHIV